MKIHHHILFDLENVNLPEWSFIPKPGVQLHFFVGATQNTLFKKCIAILNHAGKAARICRLRKTGKNALDFRLVFRLGRLVEENPNAAFLIVSKDKGFDNLVEHLRAGDIQIRRNPEIPTALLEKSKVSSIDEQSRKCINYLVRTRDSLPRTIKRLENFIHHFCGQSLSREEVAEVRLLLEEKEFLTFENGKPVFDCEGFESQILKKI